MKAHGRRLSGLFVLMGLVALLGGAAQAELIVYREIFPTNGWSGVAADISHTDWELRYGSTGATYPLGLYAPSNGMPTDAEPVNSTSEVIENVAPGIIYYNAAPSLFYTEEYTVNRSAAEIASISWYNRNNSTDSKFRVAVKIGSDWYFTTDAFSTSTTATQHTLDWSAAEWNTLNFVPGTTLSAGSPTTLPTGNLSGFGLFINTGEGVDTVRVDTFAISVVPEPTTGLLIFVGLTVLLLRHVRRPKN